MEQQDLIYVSNMVAVAEKGLLGSRGGAWSPAGLLAMTQAELVAAWTAG